MNGLTKQALLASCALMALPSSAQAQSSANADTITPPNATTATAPANSAPSAETRSPGLQDIVVTATRRSVSLQRVPATIEAVPAATLKAYNLTGILQLPSLVSGLVVTPSGGNNLYLRGIGSPSTGFNEAQTAVYIDGLYLANPTSGIFSFNNIDRIEVLKGPQGTLYGRNVTGGLISVITRNPGKTAKVDGSIGYGNYDTLTTNLYASAPLTDTLAANIAVFHQKQSKGWGRNLFTGHDDQKSNETGLQTKLVYQPSSDTKITGSFIYDFNNRDLGYAYEVYPGTLGSDGTPYIGKYRHLSRIDARAPTKIYIGSLKVEHSLGFANLMSLTGYQKSHADVLFQGGSPILGQALPGQGVTYNDFYEKNRAFSQELQLASAPSSSRLDWVAGAFYYNDHTFLQLDSFNTCIGAVCAPGFTPNRNTGRPSTKSYSAYGDLTYRFFRATRATIGLRYTDETKRLAGLVTPLPGRPNSVTNLPAAATATTPGTVFYPGQPFPGFPNGIPTRLHFGKLTYRLVLAQDVGDHLHLYASHNLGFKSGAYNGNAFNNPPVSPELLYASELGAKSELFDRHLRLNLAYFHYTYKNVQVRSLAPPATSAALLLNAAKENINGIDGDFTIAAAKGLLINGSFEYLRARYANFPGSSIAIPGTRVVNGVVVGAPTIRQNVNLAGYDTPFAPPFSASLGFTYQVDTTAGGISFSGNDHYNSPYSMNADNSVRQNRHHLLDASINWTSTDKRYDVNVYARNITKQYVYSSTIVSNNFAVVPGAPRTYGVTAGFHF